MSLDLYLNLKDTQDLRQVISLRCEITFKSYLHLLDIGGHRIENTTYRAEKYKLWPDKGIRVIQWCRERRLWN